MVKKLKVLQMKSTKTKPILFNTQMVKAILDGRKTQTRRACNIQPSISACKDIYTDMYNKNPLQWCYWCKDGRLHNYIEKPKYQVGDVLYVRETWQDKKGLEKQNIGLNYDEPLYKATEINHLKKDNREYTKIIKWKPSIHMPKEYARIFLKVIGVKVERLQDISEQDCISEGIEVEEKSGEWFRDYLEKYPNFNIKFPRESFISLWNSTTKDGDKWEDNPYVFVYEFERVEK